MSLTGAKPASHSAIVAADMRATEEQGCGSQLLRWYCAQTHPSHEHRALNELSRQKYRVWLPQIATGPVDATVIRVMFPGYLFVQFDIDHDQWRPICSTFGVRRLFGSHPERPIPVRQGVVEALIARGRIGDGVYDDRVPEPDLKGRKVKLLAGTFSGFEGICGMSTDQRVSVLLTLFGRDLPVQVLRSDVRVAD